MAQPRQGCTRRPRVEVSDDDDDDDDDANRVGAGAAAEAEGRRGPDGAAIGRIGRRTLVETLGGERGAGETEGKAFE